MVEVSKRMIQFKGKDVTLSGKELKPGEKAPEFSVQTEGWESIYGLASTSGKVRIIAAVPSLETEVCDRETRRFNQAAADLDKEVIVMVISTDLPYTQKRWCGAAGIERVIVLSDHMEGDFGARYGCLIKEVRVLHRAVFIVNKDDRITYSAYMPALGVEPNYEEVLLAAKEALDQGA